MKKNRFLIIPLLLLTITVNAQTPEKADIKRFNEFAFGAGLGMNYGGLGGCLSYSPHYNIGFFGSAGYALIGLGTNAGVKVRLSSQQSTSVAVPYLLGMYGYNTVIQVSNASDYDKFFYGLTLGAGIDLRLKHRNDGYWSFGLLIPVRGSNVDSYIDDLKKNHGIEFNNDLLPFGISVGYNFILN